jgi:hypothetical protein
MRMRLYSASVIDSLPLVNEAQQDNWAYTDASGPTWTRPCVGVEEIARSLGTAIVHRFDISVIDRRTTFKRSRASSRDAPA